MRWQSIDFPQMMSVDLTLGSHLLVAHLIGCQFFRQLGAENSSATYPAGSASLRGKPSCW